MIPKTGVVDLMEAMSWSGLGPTILSLGKYRGPTDTVSPNSEETSLQRTRLCTRVHCIMEGVS